MRDLPILIAHRGESFDAPENTLAAFALAWERRDDAIELDVHVTADGKAVVCHDVDTQRTGGVQLVIKERSLAVLRAIDVGIWKGPQWAEQIMPTLVEVFQQTPKGKHVYVEIKPGVEAIPAVVDAIAAGDWSAINIVFISFDANVIAELKRRLPKYEALWLTEPAQKGFDAWQPTPAKIIKTAQTAGADGVDVGDGPWLTADVVRQFREAGLAVGVWTVDDPVRCRDLITMGVQAITTNRAAWIRGQIL